MPSQKRAKKAGRPPLPKGDARAAFLRIPITPEELQAIRLEAKNKKKSVSEWIRSALYTAL